jgi:hypothetical protein
MGVSTKFGLSIAAFCAIGVGAFLTPACGSSETAGPSADSGAPGTSSSSGSSSGTTSSSGSSSGSASEGGTPTSAYCGLAGQKCCAAPGQVPNPECDDGDETTCPATPAAGCTVAATCGSTSTCEPLADNGTATTKDFRMRRIILVAPPALANGTVQNLVVNSGVDMNEPQCGGPTTGTGDFNWILSVDTAGNTLTTGGAPPCDTPDSPTCDPFGTGYCFVKKNVNGIQVGPVQAAISKATDGTYYTTPGAIPTLNIPIYFGTPTTIILLPISNGAITGMKLSTDGNCIGSVNTKAAAADCSDDYTQCSKWLTDGSLSGYITLKAADGVQVSLLSETLCSLLTGDTKGTPVTSPTGSPIKTCAKDANGNPTAKGNYCSTTNSAGGCQDSDWIAATFAASAVKINDGTGVADCSGGGPADAAAE